jgi:N-acetylmuramoyl-L-alanine amidase
MDGVTQRPLTYSERLDRRDPAGIVRVVIHATELPDLATARDYGEQIHYPDSRTGNSGHFYIDRDGTIEQWVPLDRIAHHVRDHNADSIGIELVHRGRWPDWYASSAQRWDDAWPEPQLKALLTLLGQLRSQLPALQFIVGHDALDRSRVPASDDPSIEVRRKLDPGPNFPWPRVRADSGLDAWPAADPPITDDPPVNDG